MKKNLFVTLLLLLNFFSTVCLAESITFDQAEDSYFEYTGGILSHTNNNGNSTEIRTANNGIFDTYGLIKFVDIFGAASNQISMDTAIISAELHLWMSRESAAFPNVINIYHLVNDWNESTVTGNSYGGNIFNGFLVDSYSKQSDDNASLPLEIVFDVTSSLISWQPNGDSQNWGWSIQSQTLHAVNYFHSSESGGDYTPFLVLNYDSNSPVPEPATMLLFGIGLLGIAGISRKK